MLHRRHTYREATQAKGFFSQLTGVTVRRRIAVWIVIIKDMRIWYHKCDGAVPTSLAESLDVVPGFDTIEQGEKSVTRSEYV